MSPNATRLPRRFRSCLPTASQVSRLRTLTYGKGLATVCREARCPNQGECAEHGTATFMILGDRCTRTCTFCAVHHGKPSSPTNNEPELVAAAVVALGLRHAVVTSVTRDDLPDGGASIFADVIRALREASPGTTVEVLIPDFRGSTGALETVIAAGPDVLNHNLETVPRLYQTVRPEASYERSLRLLGTVAERAPEVVTKSGIMVGLGETIAELRELFADLAAVGCRMLTIGQYLQPTAAHHPVDRFYGPEEFEVLAGIAETKGIGRVAAGPLVRSSYKAAEALEAVRRCPPSR